MPGLVNMEPEPAPVGEGGALPVKAVPQYGFTVAQQKLHIEVDFRNQRLTGHTEIEILPKSAKLDVIRINARQCEIPEDKVLINGRLAEFDYEDSYARLKIPSYVQSSVQQHEMQREKNARVLANVPAATEMEIALPDSVRIEENDDFADAPSNAQLHRAMDSLNARSASVSFNAGSISTPVTAAPRMNDESGKYKPITVFIPFTTKNFRDGLQFVGVAPDDTRYPHAYTKHSKYNGVASCIFPCVDDPSMRYTWDISIKCPRSLGDAFRRPAPAAQASGVGSAKKDKQKNLPNGVSSSHDRASTTPEVELSEDDKLLEMVVVCSGESYGEVIDPADSSKKTVSFVVENPLGANQIGFAIGPFEHVDLSQFREEDEDEKLGQKATQVHGYCLPGRSSEVLVTCEAMAHAVDHLTLAYSRYPFSDYSMCFVEDQADDTVPVGYMSLCSSRLLYPEDIIDPEIEVTRKLVNALANQWIGVNIVPQGPADMWLVVGIAGFITEHFMKQLCGNNEYRFNQKMLSQKLVEQDIQRPSLVMIGETMYMGDFGLEFMQLKAPLVLFILDRRVLKQSGANGLNRVIGRIFTTANTSSDRTISTQSFRRIVEKIGHYKADAFWNQWIFGAGCPRFQVSQRFNKKRVVVELTISQKQDTLPTQRKIEKGAFAREFKEEQCGIYAGEVQSCFTGPMTVRIHEADGTPYEHMVEITQQNEKIEIPYNTKYRRLKRSRRQKERAQGAGADINSENQDDVLLYCLGDVLQTADEVQEWGLSDWDAENEQKMEQESYEWIRMDADFEWCAEINFQNMPSYMYVSQLQQDRDVVAQQDSMIYLRNAKPHPLVSTFLVRTLMDKRYFYGIRKMAAENLAFHATETTQFIGQTHLEKAFKDMFCYPGTSTVKVNDFTDKKAYLLKCAIPQAMANIRNAEGKCPREARQFILDQLRFNDNTDNQFSDCFYIASLMTALTDSLITHKSADEMSFSFEDDEAIAEEENFRKTAVEVIDRFRRMDEWINSHQNIYTTTALECKRRLMKADVIKPDPREFVQYLHDGSLDVVRLKAFDALVDLTFLNEDVVIELLMSVVSTDRSAYVRNQIYEILMKGLASMAFGEHKAAEKSSQEDGGLIVEDEGDKVMEARAAQIKRTTSITEALKALKEELKGNETLKTAIWKAVCSPIIGAREQEALLAVCSVLYDAHQSMIVTLKYPKYWKAENLGKGKISFTKTNKVRTKPMPSFKPIVKEPPTPPPVPVEPRKIVFPPPSALSSKASAIAGSMKPPISSKPLKRPAPAESIEPPQKVLKHSQGSIRGSPLPPKTPQSDAPLRNLKRPSPATSEDEPLAKHRKPLPSPKPVVSPSLARKTLLVKLKPIDFSRLSLKSSKSNKVTKPSPKPKSKAAEHAAKNAALWQRNHAASPSNSTHSNNSTISVGSRTPLPSSWPAAKTGSPSSFAPPAGRTPLPGAPPPPNPIRRPLPSGLPTNSNAISSPISGTPARPSSAASSSAHAPTPPPQQPQKKSLKITLNLNKNKGSPAPLSAPKPATPKTR